MTWGGRRLGVRRLSVVSNADVTSMTTRREEHHEHHAVSGAHVGETAHTEKKEKGLLEKIFGVRGCGASPISVR